MQEEEEMENYLTVKDVAELLRLKEKTIYKMAEENRLPFYKVGGSLRFKREEIDRSLRASRSRRRRERK